MFGEFTLLFCGLVVLVLGIFLQIRVRRQIRGDIAASPDGPRVVERGGESYFEGEEGSV